MVYAWKYAIYCPEGFFAATSCLACPFPNQVNNVVAFPGIFKGALEGRAQQITEEMKLAAATAIAGLVPEEELSENNILPAPFDPRVCEVVSAAVKSHIC